MTHPTTSGAADLPEALYTIQRYEVVDCIDSKHVPAVIPNPHGPWVRYEDHAAALTAQAISAEPAGAGYAALTADQVSDICDRYIKLIREKRAGHIARGIDAGSDYYIGDVGHFIGHAVNDALSASHGQAPAQPVDFTTLGAAMRAIQQAIGLIGDPADERMQAVRRVLRGAVVVAEDSGDIPAQPDCLTCNDHGAVGKILTAEPCPDCTPSPQAADSVTAPAAYSGNLEQELAMLIRRIVSSARRNCEDGSNVLKLANEAWAYLVRKGLNGSPLRDAGIESDPTPPAQAADSVLEDAAQESDYRRGYRHGYEQRDAEVRGALA